MYAWKAGTNRCKKEAINGREDENLELGPGKIHQLCRNRKVASYRQEKQKQRPQRLLLLRCLLEGGSLAFGEWAEEEELQGPKLVNKRLSSGCDRFVCVTCQKNETTKQNKKQQKKTRQRHAFRRKQKGMKDTHCRMHPYLWRGTPVYWWYDDVCGPPMRCVVRMIDNVMSWRRERP
jgi:hypothetical protein